MRNAFFIILSVMGAAFFIIPNSLLFAEDQYYMGIGGSYASADLDSRFEGGDSIGVNFKSGSIYSDWFSAELNVDYFPEFEDKATIEISGAPVNTFLEMEILSFIMNAKLSLKIQIIFFAHHYHLVDLAKSTVADKILQLHTLT